VETGARQHTKNNDDVGWNLHLDAAYFAALFGNKSCREVGAAEGNGEA